MNSKFKRYFVLVFHNASRGGVVLQSLKLFVFSPELNLQLEHGIVISNMVITSIKSSKSTKISTMKCLQQTERQTNRTDKIPRGKTIKKLGDEKH